MNTLDKDRIEFLIDTLIQAKNLGFSSLSSPMELLFEAAVDLCLLLSTHLKEGKKAIYTLPEISFSRDKVDALGNPLQISVSTLKPEWRDQEASEYIKKLASLFVLLKRRHSLPDSLKESGLADVRPTQQEKPVMVLNTERAQQKKKKMAERRRSSYHRRQRNKK
jgi:hypothetical protein